MRSTDRPESMRVQRWEARGEWPLAFAAILFLVAYAWPILDPHIAAPWRLVCKVTDYSVWVLFVLDYLARLMLADRRGVYWRRHLLDLAVIALPILRPLRLLRLVMLLQALNRRATASLQGRIAIYVTGSTTLLIFCASLAVLDAERHRGGANITTFGTALWWAAVTVTTVGYGDHFPITGEGRLVAVGLMIGGIALLGTVTAAIATWLISRVREQDEAVEAVTRADLRILADKIDALHEQLAGSLLADVAPAQALHPGSPVSPRRSGFADPVAERRDPSKRAQGRSLAPALGRTPAAGRADGFGQTSDDCDG